MWRQALGIVKKDVRYIYRERQQILMFILLPIIILFLFIIVFGGMGGDGGGFVPDVAVVDLDGGDYGSRMGVNMSLDPTINIVYLNETAGNLTAAEAYLDSGDIDAVVVFPPGFSASLASFQRASVNVTVDATEMTVGMTTDRIITAFFAGETGFLQQEATSMMAQFGGDRIPSTGFMSEPVSLETSGVVLEQDVYNVNAVLLSQALSFAIIWIGVMAGSSGLAFERINRTFERIVTSPAPAVSVYIGKLISYTIELLFVSVIMIAIAVLVLGVEILADPLTVSVVLVLAVLPAIALGMMFSSLVKKAQTGMTLAWVFAMPAGFIGGAFVPPEILPPSTALIQAIFPFATAQQALQDTFMRGYNITEMLGSIGYLALLASIYIAIGLVIYIIMQRRGRLA